MSENPPLVVISAKDLRACLRQPELLKTSDNTLLAPSYTIDGAAIGDLVRAKTGIVTCGSGIEGGIFYTIPPNPDPLPQLQKAFEVTRVSSLDELKEAVKTIKDASTRAVLERQGITPKPDGAGRA